MDLEGVTAAEDGDGDEEEVGEDAAVAFARLFGLGYDARGTGEEEEVEESVGELAAAASDISTSSDADFPFFFADPVGVLVGGFAASYASNSRCFNTASRQSTYGLMVSASGLVHLQLEQMVVRNDCVDLHFEQVEYIGARADLSTKSSFGAPSPSRLSARS